ncbi:MAG TPA: Bax inhibitor-1/YccA family protein [Aggregatilineales bacterium]|jgi:FtsH-binding integral membrane protein|nr:Bax inhibitor-1/YccA family protein [Aggregatilineales bacterium]
MGFGFNQDNLGQGLSSSLPRVDINMQSVMRNVFIWMTLALGLTAVVGWVVSSTEALWPIVYNPITMIVSFIAIIAMAIIIPVGMKRRWLSPTMAIVLFFVFAGVMGMMLSSIFLVYTSTSIVSALVTTMALFGTMVVFGLTTKMDLMKYSTYFMIGLIGLVVAMVINIFLQSSALEMLISIIGVIIFTALTAYDTQKIKRMAESYEVQSDSGLAIKVSVYGALELYLDFINLFLFLLRLFGGSRD